MKQVNRISDAGDGKTVSSALDAIHGSRAAADVTVSERQEKILELLRERPDIKVAELAKRLYVSEPTVRRDFTELDAKGLIHKVYGGAILPDHADRTVPFVLREHEKSQAKTVMGKRAAELVSDGMVLLLDGSTSVFHLVPYLADKKDLVVITSGAKTALALAEAGICTYCTGGKMLIHSYSYVGAQAERFLGDINADLAFFSCRGLSGDGGVSDSSEEEINLRRVMMSQSRASYLLCDSGKFGKSYLFHLCRINQLSGVISDKPWAECKAPDQRSGMPQ